MLSRTRSRLPLIPISTFVALAISLLLFFPARPLNAQTVPVYKNVRAPLEDRVNDLYRRLTEQEKLSMLTGTNFGSQPLPRLGLKGMQFADAGQGVRGGSADHRPDPIAGPATAFPAGVSMATSWDRNILSSVGRAIGEEAQNKGTGIQIELGPAVNIHRSPLNGRDSEYLSEDPYLNSRLAVSYIEGMQSTGTGACVKHFACNNEETDRGEVNVVVDERTLREIYLPAFEAAVKEAHVRSIMSAYNKVNGPYCSANWYLLTNVLRNDWGYDGLVMSDWGAVHVTAGVVNAGLDLEMPGPNHLAAKYLKAALADGSITHDEINHAVKDILRATIREGLADPTQHVPVHSVVGSAPEQAVAYKAGVEGMVLLKNNNSLLPLDSNTIKSIAIIGPRAKFWQFNAHGSPGLTPTVQVNAYDGIVQRLAGNKNIRISYDAGRDYNGGEPIPVADLTTPSGEHGFSGSYFSNETLDGAPVLTRTDQSIDFDWNNDTRPKGIGREHYSIRWNASLTAPSTGTYTFNVHVDDGCRLWIGDTLVVDDWNVGGGREDSGTITLNVGQIYPLKLEYFQDGGDASVSLSWKTPTYVYAPYKAAAEIASQSDVAIVLVGSEPEGEGSDRKSMDLPDNQDALIQAVSKANPHTVVVLDNGAPVLVNSWLDGVPAVLGAGFSGELGGKALAAILFGDENPSGKLVDTYGVRREDYPDYGNFPGVRNVVRYTEGIYVGYRAFDKRNITPEFPFGYGLSYTTFSYSKIKLQKPAWNPSGAFLVTADITNAGHRKGAEVAQLYIEPQSPQIDRPIRELKGFDRVELAPGQTKTVTFPLTPRDFAYCDVPGKQWRADKGEYTIEVGASSRNLLLKALLTLTQTWTEAIPGIGAVDPSLPKPSLATGMTGSASSDTNSNVAQYAFDNDPNTRWESRYSDPQWLAVDLKTPTSISRVRINWETAFSDKFQLQVSNDNANWNIVYSTENGPGGIQTITFPGPVTARYVRLFMIHRATQFGDSIWSFDVYAK